MKETNTLFDKIIFWLELALFIFIPFIIWWSITPTSVLNSNALYKLLESVSIFGIGIIFLTGIPVGIVGIIKARRMIELRRTTLALSIINLVVGSLEIIILLLIICAVVFWGASV